MANTLILKRSSVAAKVPTVGDLSLGEMALNTYDGKLFARKNNGADSVVEIGAVRSVASRTGDIVLSNSDVSGSAPILSPALTGVPTAPTAAAGTNTTQVATTAFVGTAVANLVDASPTTLNTLNELAAALGDDPNFATTMTNNVALKAPIAAPTFTGISTMPYHLVNRVGNVASGIQWYSTGYNAWCDYMGPAGVAGQGPNGTLTPVNGTLVTSWGRRSYIENNAGFGWTFESGVNSAVSPTIMAEISSTTGNARFVGTVTATGFSGTATLTGTPTTPTAAVSTNTTQIATTAFTVAQIANDAPTKVGTGASGTWGITITGNSATSSLAYSVHCPDGDRNADTKLPSTSGNKVRYDFVNASTTGSPGATYAGLMTFAPWQGTTASTGDASYQLAFSSTATNGAGLPVLNLRKGIDSTWNSWYTIFHSGNFNTYAPTLTGTGASGTWGINISGNAATVTTNANLTGSVTSVGNSTSVTANAITLAHMAQITTASILGRNTAATGNVEVLSAATVKSILAITNVDNTSDANKPVSTATQTALNLKATIASPTFTGVVTSPTYTSSVTTGTAPLSISSTTVVTNLNADLLDGYNAATTNTASTVVVRDGGGGITGGFINSTNFYTTAGDGIGLGFWGGVNAYGIHMSTAGNATFGGRVTGDTTSDYNMYFRMAQGTNRGFVFENAYASKLFSINGDGVRSNVGVTINGALYATSKSFRIDHPTKPDKKLVYGSLEGPEHGVYIRGKLSGSSKIELPEYWTKLIDPDSITVQLSAIGRGQQLYIDCIKDNTVTIGNDNLLNKAINCFYFIQATRADIPNLEVEI